MPRTAFSKGPSRQPERGTGTVRFGTNIVLSPNPRPALVVPLMLVYRSAYSYAGAVAEDEAGRYLGELATRFAQSNQRSFYLVVNALPAFRRAGVPREVLTRWIPEMETLARREVAISLGSAEELVVLTKTRLDFDELGRARWLKELKPRVEFQPGGVRRTAWAGGTRHRGRISLWASLVAMNVDLAPPEVRDWASLWTKQANFWASRLYDCSHDVVSAALFGHMERAEKMTERILDRRDPVTGAWDDGNVTLTLKIATNLLEAGTITRDGLGVTTRWIDRRLADPGSLDLRQLSWGLEYLCYTGNRPDERSILSASRLLQLSSASLCGLGEGLCANAPQHTRADSAFYITSFEPEFDEARTIVRRTCSENGITILDTESEPLARIRDLPCRWCSGIGQSMIVIADMSAMDRPNVPFELGFSVSQGKRLIILFNPEQAKSRGYASFMSDIPHIFRLEYRTARELGRKLNAELRRSLDVSSP